MTYVKICGISREADAEAAAGADFIGLMFAVSPRRVTMEQAQALVEAVRSRPTPPKAVGVFANNPLDEVNETARALALDYVQISGDEPDDYVRRVEAPVIRSVHVEAGAGRQPDAAALAARLAALRALGATPLLDTKVDARYGGTGRRFDHAAARDAAREHDFLLAGGLTPENVAEAVAGVRPWGVDVSSGVETGGVKDAAKIRAFITAVRDADGPSG